MAALVQGYGNTQDARGQQCLTLGAGDDHAPGSAAVFEPEPGGRAQRDERHGRSGQWQGSAAPGPLAARSAEGCPPQKHSARAIHQGRSRSSRVRVFSLYPFPSCRCRARWWERRADLLSTQPDTGRERSCMALARQPPRELVPPESHSWRGRPLRRPGSCGPAGEGASYPCGVGLALYICSTRREAAVEVFVRLACLFCSPVFFFSSRRNSFSPDK